MWICCESPWTCACSVRVPVHTFGEPQGVKLQGGIFEMVTREVEIECLPAGHPGRIQGGRERPDDSATNCARAICRSTRKDKLVTDPQRVIAHVVALREEGREAGGGVAAGKPLQRNPKSSRRARRKKRAKKGRSREAGKGRETRRARKSNAVFRERHFLNGVWPAPIGRLRPRGGTESCGEKARRCD